jgi:hypothetical protein
VVLERPQRTGEGQKYDEDRVMIGQRPQAITPSVL